MADPLPDPGAEAGTPRWVKVFGIIAAVVVLLVVLALLFGGGPGRHGPGRHAGSDDAGGRTAPTDVTKSGGVVGHTPPPGIPEHGAQEP